MSTIIWIVILIVALAAGIGAGYFIGYNNRKKTAEAQIGSAEAEATRLVNEAIKTAEQKRKEAVLEAKDEAFKLKAEVDAQKAEADKEIKQRRAEISRQENRIDQKETALDRKTEVLEKKEEELKKRAAEAEERLAEIEALQARFDAVREAVITSERDPAALREEIRLLYEKFIKDQVFTIDDVEQFCHESGYAPRLPNLQRLIFARLRLDDHIYGYIEVVNPAPEQMEKALPLLRAHAKHFGKMALVHFDAHTDTYANGCEFDHGTMFFTAPNEGLIDPNHSVQIGIRTEFDRDNGFTVLDACQVNDRSVDDIIAQVKQIVGDMPVYLTFDIDALDPAFAPGTGTPVIGGLTSDRAIKLVRGLKDLNIVGMDVVEVAPAYDQSEITALAAATLALEMLYIQAAKKGE